MLVTVSWSGIVLFTAQLEERMIEHVAQAICMEHRIRRQELAVTYKETA